MFLAKGPSRARALPFLIVLLGCEAGAAPSGPEQQVDLAAQEQALVCLRGPAFPSCFGTCGFLDCSPIDPGACCACDTGCVARGDCCCDYRYECVHDTIPTCSATLPPAEAQERAAAVAAPAGALYVAGDRARPAGFASDLVDGFLRRVDPVTLAPVWERSIDNCFWDSIQGVAALASGDAVVVGSTRDGAFATTPTRVLLRRYSGAGALVWQISPVSPLGDVTGLAVAVDPVDQSLVVTGAVTTATAMFPLAARFSADGDLLWMRALGTLAGHVGRAVAVSSSSRIAIAAQNGGTAAKTLLLDASGALQWTTNEGAGTSAADVAFAGTEIVSVSSLRSAGTLLARLARYKPTGVLRYSRNLDLGSRHWNPVGGVAVSAGDAILAGNVAMADGSMRAWLARYTASGVLSWSRVRATPTLTQVVGVALSGASAFSAAQDTAALTRTIVLRDAL